MLSNEQKEQKKKELLEKCFELFVQQGLENTSLNELAAYCNMHKPTFYYYLDSKEEVVHECAVAYMTKIDEMFFRVFENPQKSLKEALKHGFKLISEEKNKFKYIYQVISSPKYGKRCREELTKIYSKYMDYSVDLAKIYNVNHAEFRPYFLLFIATIHDYCLWENDDMVREKLDYIFERVDKLEKYE